MHALTLATITAAQHNDETAIGEVLDAMQTRIESIARKLSANDEQQDEFAQIGRIAVWEALTRFGGATVDAFFAFMYSTVDGRIRDAVRDDRSAGATGADHDALKIFAAMVKEANGDVDVAERLAQTLPPKGRRLSAERAYIARQAWEGVGSLNWQIGEFGGFILADAIESDYGVPEDLIEASDRDTSDRDRKVKLVRAVLDSMGIKQAHILRATYGIDPAPCLGSDAAANAELAAELDTTPNSVKVLRSQAHKAFEARYGKVAGLAA
jgi:RNA polymerase sigma factor (sigma-70 family)